MTKSELKSKIKQLADELHEEHRLTNMMEQEKARHRRKILQSVGHLRGGSTSSTQARLVNKGRTPTGAYHVGMDSVYVDKPQAVPEQSLKDLIRYNNAAEARRRAEAAA